MYDLSAINIIIAVMELRREPYLLKFKKDNEAAVAKKIRELQLAAEQQRDQVKSFLIDDPTEPSHPEPPPLAPTASARTIKLENNETRKTARKKDKPEDLPPEIEQCLAEVRRDSREKSPLPKIVIPGREEPKEVKEEDKELEYLKSEEYKKYLEKLTQAHSKEDKAKVIKENRNNNVYLGKKGMDRKQYIQEIIKTKEVLPRVNLEALRKEEPLPVPTRDGRAKGKLVDSYMYNDRESKPKQLRNERPEPTRREIEQESPIKCVQQEFIMPNNIEKLTQKVNNNVTIDFSPLSQKQQPQDPPPKQVTMFYHNYYSKIPEVPKATASPKASVSPRVDTSPRLNIRPSAAFDHPYTKPVIPNPNLHRCDTYRKESQYCERLDHATERQKAEQQRYDKRKDKPKWQDKENYRKKASPSPSESSSPRDSRERGNIYTLSFKLDKPSQANLEYKSTTLRHESRSPLKPRQPAYNYRHTPERPAFVKHSDGGRQRLFTEQYYDAQPSHSFNPPYSNYPSNPSYPSNSFYPGYSNRPASQVQWGWREEQVSCSRSPRKISLISRSKLRRVA